MVQKKCYLLSQDDVIQICASLRFSMQAHEDVKCILRKIREKRILSDEEVRQYNAMTVEIGKLNQVYQKFS